MKKRVFLALLLSVLLVFSAFAACNFGGDSSDTGSSGGASGSSSSSSSSSSSGGTSGGSSGGSSEENPPEYTEEENALYWISCRDQTANYKGAYHVIQTESELDGEYLYETTITESWDYDKQFYYIKNVYDVTDGQKVLHNFEKAALKIDNGEEYERGLFYETGINEDEESEESNIYEKARYVEPHYVKEWFMHYFPAEQITDYGIENGDNLADLKQNAIEFFAENGPELKSMKFLRNSDDSVTLELKAFFEGDLPETNEETGETVTCHFVLSHTFTFTAKNGKIVEITGDTTESDTYEDATLNYNYKSKRVIEMNYAFDQKGLDEIDVSNVEPVNAYYPDVCLNIDGDIGAYFYDDSLAGETITEKQLVDYFNRNQYMFIGNDDNSQLFEIYLDKNLTERFTSVTLTQEEYNFYIKFVVPDDKALVFTLFEKTNDKNEKYSSLHLVYVWDLNKRFYPRDTLKNYEVISVNGKPVEGYSSFLCDESKVYTVLYSENYHEEPIEVTHGALSEWEISETAHWHGCNECNLDRFDWEMHSPIIVDEKQVCKVCEYVMHVFTEEENFADWLASKNASVSFDNVYTYSSELNYLDAQTKNVLSKTLITEGNAFSKYYFVKEELNAAEDGTLKTASKYTTALKNAKLDGKTVRLRIEIEEADDKKASTGFYKDISYSANDMAYYLPKDWFTNFCIAAVTADNLADFKKSFIATYNSEQNCQTYNLSFKRNADESVSFFYSAKGEYVEKTMGAGYEKTVYECLYEIVASTNYITKTIEKPVFTKVFSDETQNEVLEYVYTQNFKYNAFDYDLYDSIPTETDTTIDQTTSE